jgi:hypothetical protein
MTNTLEVRWTGELSKIHVEPGDLLVLRTSMLLDDHTAEVIRGRLRDLVGEHAKVLVLDSGCSLEVLRAETGLPAVAQTS